MVQGALVLNKIGKHNPVFFFFSWVQLYALLCSVQLNVWARTAGVDLQKLTKCTGIVLNCTPTEIIGIYLFGGTFTCVASSVGELACLVVSSVTVVKEIKLLEKVSKC